MANKTINDLPAKAGTLAGTEKIEIDDGSSKSVTAQQIADLAGAGLSLIPVRVVAGTTDIMVIGDTGGAIHCTSSSAISVTIPPASSVDFEVGANTLIRQFGTGVVTVVAGAGVTLINGLATAKTAGQYKGSIAVHKIDTNTWFLDGTVAAS